MSSVYSCGAASSYSYDSVGRLSKITSSTDTGANNLEYNFTYDSYGRLEKISVGSQPLMTTEYDQYSRPKTKTYGNNQYFKTYYDDLDRVKEIVYNDDINKSVKYLYANDGNLAYVIDRFSDTKTQYIYDLSGRVVDVRVYANADINDYTTLENWVKYAYSDKTNYLTAMVHWTPETDVQQYEYIYGDEALGQMPDQVYTVKLNGQVVQSYGFDELGRQTAKTVPLANGTLGHYYSYKHLYDNRSSTQVESFVNRLGTYTFTYDFKGNITQEVFVPWGENLQGYTKTYEYDALNQLTRCIEDIGNHWYYQYDKAGNIVYEECIDSQNVYTIKHYTYGEANWRDLLTSYNGESIDYDAIGNPTVYRGASLTWSEGRRLASYSKNGQNISFQYDADGKRISKNVNGTVYNYIYNQGTLVGICENDSLLLEFIVDEKGDYIGLYYDGLPYYYVRNVQGDVVAISDQWGNNIVGYTYDPWGKVTSVYGQEAWFGYINPIRYRGYFYDEETSLYYLQSRYYDPESNRFINADEASVVTVSPDSANYDKNLYAYCDNNPVVRSDTSGYAWHIAIGAVIAGAFELRNELSLGKTFSEVNWAKVGVATLSGGITAALGPVGGALISGVTNMALAALDGERDAKDLLVSGVVGAGVSLIGSGAGKVVESVGGKLLAPNMLSKLSKTKLKSVVTNLAPVIKGTERNKIKNISYLIGTYKDIGRKYFTSIKLGKALITSIEQYTEGIISKRVA